MKFSTSVAIFFAASIALAIAYPTRYYEPSSSDESGEYPDGRTLLASRQPYTLATAPFFYQPRNLELESKGGKKYTIVKKKKTQQGAPLPASEEDDEPQDEEEESSEEEEDEEEDDVGVPSWDKMFPEEDKNTGTFDNGGYGPQPQGGQGGAGGSLADLPTGVKAPESSGSLWNFFTGGSSGSSEGSDYDQGPQGPPYQAIRGRTSLSEVEEPRSGGAVLYDGYRYIPVKPVHVQVHQRQSKKAKNNNRQESGQTRSLNKPATTSQNKKSKKQYVLVPVDRDGREVRFSRDQHGFKMENGPVFAPTEIWRWEGPAGRPLRRRGEHRPSAPYFTRPHRGTPTIRFREDSDY